MTLEDLANYKVKVYRSIQGTYRGRKLYVPGAPTSGVVLLHMLNLVEHFEQEGWIQEGKTGLNVHRIIEAMKCELCPFSDMAMILPFDTRLLMTVFDGGWHPCW